jgi:hypothetical protein
MTLPNITALVEAENLALRHVSLDEQLILSDLALKWVLAKNDGHSKKFEDIQARTGTLLGKSVNYEQLLSDTRFQAIVATIEARLAIGEISRTIMAERNRVMEQALHGRPKVIATPPAPIVPVTSSSRNQLHLILALVLGTVIGGTAVHSCQTPSTPTISSNK